jgi:hypothetical protein
MNVIVIIVMLIVIGGIVGAIVGLTSGSGGGGSGGSGGSGGTGGTGGTGGAATTIRITDIVSRSRTITKTTGNLVMNYDHSSLAAATELCSELLDDIVQDLDRGYTFNIQVWRNLNSAGSITGNTIKINEIYQNDLSPIWFDGGMANKSTMGVILLHEILHGLGMVAGNYASNQIQVAYRQMTLALVKNLTTYNNVCPIEDDGGTGSVNSHFEEGKDFSAGRVPTGSYIYPNEIMSPRLDTVNFVTPMTLGALHGIGITVNYQSDYVFNPINQTDNVIGKTTPDTLRDTRVNNIRTFIVEKDKADLDDNQLNNAT